MSEFDIDVDFDLGGFDFDFDDEIEKPSNRFILPKVHSKVRSAAVKYEYAEDMVIDCGQAILDGEKVHAVVSGNFIFGDFFEALAVKFNIKFDDITLSTLSLSKDNVDSFNNLLAGDFLGSLNVIVSDYFWSHNRQNAPYIYNKLDINNMFQLAVAGTHTKITLIKIGDQKIVIKGSANLRSSRCVEEFTVETCEELYDFHKEWHDEILKEYGTIQKSIRASMLFDKITENTEGRKTWLHE